MSLKGETSNWMKFWKIMLGGLTPAQYRRKRWEAIQMAKDPDQISRHDWERTHKTHG